jgi:hypothetical protein
MPPGKARATHHVRRALLVRPTSTSTPESSDSRMQTRLSLDEPLDVMALALSIHAARSRASAS